MNRFKTPIFRLAICGFIAAAAVTGCSAGQQSQTATQEPAVNGTSATVNSIALRDVRLVASQHGDALPPGETVDLAFVAVNQSPDTADRLVSVTSEVGKVALTGKTDIGPSQALIVGTIEGAEAIEASVTQNTAKATVTLTKPITNGLNYDFTFAFERAGQVTIAVPVSADDAPRQEPAGQHGEHQ